MGNIDFKYHIIHIITSKPITMGYNNYNMLKSHSTSLHADQ